MRKEVIAQTADKLRRIYIQRRTLHCRIMQESAMLTESMTLHPKWDGGTDSRGVRHKPVWPKLAEYAVTSGLDPETWIATLFYTAYLFDHVPWPSDLTNSLVLSRVATQKKDGRLDLRCATQTELVTLAKERYLRKQSLGDSQAVDRGVLMDPGLDVSALPRYIAALRTGYGDVAAVLEVSALSQYLAAADVYQEVLGIKLPERLKKLAAAFQSEGSGFSH